MSGSSRRGFGSIRQTKSGRWQARYTAADGKRVAAPTTYARKVDAASFLSDRRRELARESWAGPRPERVLFSDYAIRWLDQRRTAGRPLKAYTVQQYTQVLEHHLIPEFGDEELTAITPQRIRQWHAGLSPDAPAMRAYCYRLMHTVMRSAYSDELVASDPCRLRGAGQTEKVHVTVPATVEDLRLATKAVPPELRLSVSLSSWCSLRFGEAFELRRGDLDLHNAQVRVRRAVVRLASGEFRVDTPKSKAGVRNVSIPPHLIEAVEHHLATYVAAAQDSLLFPASLDTPQEHMPSYRVMYQWKKARKAAGREDLRWHDLRHAGAVLAAATGCSIADLQARLGHASPAAAMRYQHAAKGRDQEIAELLYKHCFPQAASNANRPGLPGPSH
jgi:integrase